MNEDKTIELPSLGRPVQLGMLYDCRSDTFVAGLTLWDPEVLQGYRDVRPQQETQFKIISSDTFENKASALNIETSLKASVLSGLVEMKGSAKYLNDRKISSRQYRLTLQYSSTTKFEQLTMKHLGLHNVQHPHVFDQGTATHVVTGILYGAQAFFVFDRQLVEGERDSEIKGHLTDLILKIPKQNIAAEGQVSKLGSGVEKNDFMQCTFYGDFALLKNPTSYSEAKDVYKELPSLLGENGAHAVPMRIWLYPLYKLDSKAAKLVREISVNYVSRIQDILVGLRERQVTCDDLSDLPICQEFPLFTTKLGLFKKLVADYMLILQQKLAKVLPSIRGGGMGEQELGDVLYEHEMSPYCLTKLDGWLENHKKEIKVVETYMSLFTSLRVMHTSENLEELIIDPSIQHIFSFSFPLIGHEDDYLCGMSRYNGTPTAGEYSVNKIWCRDRSMLQRMRERAQEFVDFAEANNDNNRIVFAVMCLDDDEPPSTEGGCIFHYENGNLKEKDYKPPNKLRAPVIVGKKHDKVDLRWQPPESGTSDINSYQVRHACEEGDITLTEISKSKTSVTISNLRANTSYTFIVYALYVDGFKQSSYEKGSIKTLCASPPSGLARYQVSRSSITVEWEKPACTGKDVNVIRYCIQYSPEDDRTKQQTMETDGQVTLYTLQDLTPDTIYTFQVAAYCGEAGWTHFSEPLSITTAPEFIAIETIIKHNERADDENWDTVPKLYRIPLDPEELPSDAKYRVYHFGQEEKYIKNHRVIMLVGATGSGKSTLINGMVNCILRVEWRDPFRFKIIASQGENLSGSQASSQTQIITCYTIHPNVGLDLKYTLTIIDTPGFGDTRGIEQDNIIIEQVRDFFSKASDHHIDHVDIIGLVAQASQPRLTPTQRYVFDSILSLFGKDTANNIMLLVTFADGQKPPLLDSVKAANIPFSNKIFKFNNSALFANNTPSKKRSTLETNSSERLRVDEKGFDALFWDMGVQNMEQFFIALDKMEPKSLTLTKEVLFERKQLQLALDGLQVQIDVAICKLEELKKEHTILEEHKEKIEEFKDFEYTVDVPKSTTKSIEYRNANNCTTCKFTCHSPCWCWDLTLRTCAATAWTGSCKVCPGKCSVGEHRVQDHIYEYTVSKEKRKYSDIEEKYKDATGKKLSVEDVIKRHREELRRVEGTVYQLIHASYGSFKRLQEIALKPDPLNAIDYIDLLIEDEKREHKEGWKSRIKTLKNIRKKADILNKIKEPASHIGTHGTAFDMDDDVELGCLSVFYPLPFM